MVDPRTETVRTRREQSSTVWAVVGIVVALIAGVWIWAAWGDRNVDETAGITVEDISENPQLYEGQFVTVSGEVDDMLEASSFTLEKDGVDGDELLVINATGDVVSLREEDEVLVTGNVHVFERAVVEEEFGYDLDDEAFATWEGKPVLIASAIDRRTADQELDYYQE